MKAGHLETIVSTADASPLGVPSKTIYDTDLLKTANVIDDLLTSCLPSSSMICIASIAVHSCPPLSPECYQYPARAPRERLLEQPEVDSGLEEGFVLRVQAVSRVWGLKGAHINVVSPGDLDSNEYAGA